MENCVEKTNVGANPSGELETEIVFGPSNKPEEKLTFRQRLWEAYSCATCAVLTVFLFVGPALLLLFCLIPRCWPFGLAYLAWMYYDRDTPHTGGRRLKCLRRMSFWRYRRDYFPIKLVKTAELPPDTTYMFPSFPHGMLVFGATTNFGSNVNHFDDAFPGLNPFLLTLNVNLNWPLTRELLLGLGVCACSKRSILNILNGPPGNVSVLIVGGIAEALKSLPGTYRLVLKNRKGFVRVALKAGSSLVPVFSFGETNTYDQMSSEWYWWLQGKLRKTTGFPFLIVKGRGIFSQSLRIMPYKVPITTVVGKPIKLPKDENPSEELVNKYHQIFIKELTDLFNKYKGKYDVDGENATLSIE